MGKKPGFVFPAVCPIDLPKTNEGDDEPLADARVFPVADDARLELVLNAFVGLENAPLTKFGRVTTRGRHGHCEHCKNGLANLGAARGIADSKEAIGAFLFVTVSLANCY